MKLIDKDRVVTEIERIKKEECPTDTYEGRCKLFWFEQFLSFLHTLETKEINNVWYNAKRTIPEDGHEQIICIKEDGLAVSTVGKIVNGTIKWAYLSDLLDTSSFNVEMKDDDIEQEVANWWNEYYGDIKKNYTFEGYTGHYMENSTIISLAKHFFKLGLIHKGE